MACHIWYIFQGISGKENTAGSEQISSFMQQNRSVSESK